MGEVYWELIVMHVTKIRSMDRIDVGNGLFVGGGELKVNSEKAVMNKSFGLY